MHHLIHSIHVGIPTKQCQFTITEWVLLYTGQVQESYSIDVKDLSLTMEAQKKNKKEHYSYN